MKTNPIKCFLKLATALLFIVSFPVTAIDFDAKKVADGIYAYIGPITDRTPENLGLNNNIGFIDTPDGWVLIDSGSGDAGAKKLHQVAKHIKDQPIVAVINLGSQDHRWLGNDYFSKHGATIYAYKDTVKTQKTMFNDVVGRMVKNVPLMQGVKMKTADVVLDNQHSNINVGGIDIQINYYGDAHFPGDTVVWLPKQQVLFTGDMVYLDRMLGVHPWSNPISWNQAYQKMRKLPAQFIVPGHGQVSDWKQVDSETGDYLKKLNETMLLQAEEMAGVETAVSENQDWSEFKHLKHYSSWHKTNLNRTYLKIESTM